MAKTKYDTEKRSTHDYHHRVEMLFKSIEEKLKKPLKFTTKRSFEAIVFLIIFFTFFGLLAYKMTLPKMLNTFMQTSYHLLLETVFYIMAICVLMGAISKLLTEFGVVRLMENILRPLMKPLYNLPGVAALGAILTFLSDNPAIISLAQDKNFSQYFKKYQLVSLTNFGTAFGMGLMVLAFMTGLGFGKGALVGIVGAIIGSIVSTRLMQRFTLRSYPELDTPVAEYSGDEQQISFKSEGSVFQRFLNSLLDGGKDGVSIGFAIIPGVLCISTLVMMLTFGPDAATHQYTGAAYEGVPVITWLADKINVVFYWLFGFQNGALVSFPITALGAVGAALGLVPRFISEGIIDNNAIATVLFNQWDEKARTLLRYNPNGGNPIFSCYASGQQPVYFYVESDGTATYALEGVRFTQDNKYATWFGDKDLALPEGVSAYVVSGVSGEEATISAIEYIPANVGVILECATHNESDLTTTEYDGTPIDIASLLQGSLESTEIKNGYVLYNNEFVLTSAGTLAAHRCYLPKQNAAGAPERLRIGASGVVTAIDDVNAARVAAVKYVSVTGQVSDRPFNGVNIVVTRNTDGTITTTKVVK